ncbi:hypothetical protein SAMN05880570_2161 [Paenibacillus sp. RU4T]|nr:hypothetical protein SAMN05880555_2162 [Paenibacillus sp. RU4X]SIQ94990.1 hypothetical protein SAMN05880570_2161 [Paenibacillus sp. RU4T]
MRMQALALEPFKYGGAAVWGWKVVLQPDELRVLQSRVQRNGLGQPCCGIPRITRKLRGLRSCVFDEAFPSVLLDSKADVAGILPIKYLENSAQRAQPTKVMLFLQSKRNAIQSKINNTIGLIAGIHSDTLLTGRQRRLQG